MSRKTINGNCRWKLISFTYAPQSMCFYKLNLTKLSIILYVLPLSSVAVENWAWCPNCTSIPNVTVYLGIMLTRNPGSNKQKETQNCTTYDLWVPLCLKSKARLDMSMQEESPWINKQKMLHNHIRCSCVIFYIIVIYKIICMTIYVSVCAYKHSYPHMHIYIYINIHRYMCLIYCFWDMLDG